VLVTGASSGIGLATAVEFAGEGSRVALLARSTEGLRRAADAVAEAGGSPLVVPADVTDRGSLSAAIDRTAGDFGGLDVVVVNAGAAAYGAFSETDPDDFDRTLDVTLRGAVDTARAALPHLEATGGALLVVGSVADKIPLPLMSAYTAAKHGLRGFVDALTLELRGEGSSVSVSLVSPGPVDTPFWDNVAAQEGHLPPSIPLAYDPVDVGKAVAECARRRRAGLTVGGSMVVVGAVHSVLNPLSSFALSRLGRWARRAGKPGDGRRAIQRPAGRGELRAGLSTRPSLVARGFAAAGSLLPRR
jgi:NAD(P)-dependent dehydrogenase (short-subunit alcohol dehydrogenase family)